MSVAPSMADSRARFLVGIDTGGTFTDLVAFDVHSGTLSTSKTPSVPSQPGQALLDAVQAADLSPGRYRRARPWHDRCHQCADRAHRRPRVAADDERGTRISPISSVSIARRSMTCAGRNRNRSLPSRRDSVGVRERIGS